MNKIWFSPNMIILMSPLIMNFLLISIMMIPKKHKFHPILLLMILILLTSLITLKMNLIYYTLMSFILFLAMIGGLMIIFLYITSLTNNELFFINLNMIFMNFLKILPLSLIYMYIMFNYSLPYYLLNFNIQDSWKINMFQFIYDQMNMNILFNMMINKSSIFMMMYIYYSMICIMNICYKLKSPLRQLMY